MDFAFVPPTVKKGQKRVTSVFGSKFGGAIFNGE